MQNKKPGLPQVIGGPDDTFNIRLRQEITLLPVTNKTFGDPDFNVTAFASSGLPVTFTAYGACTISGNKVHITKVGVCTITVHQDGNDQFEAAPDVSQSFSVDPARLIVKSEDKTMIYGGTMPALSAAISGLVSSDSLGNLSFKTTALPGSPPGDYSIIPGGLNSTDYIIDYVTGTLTILPARVTVKADSKSIRYGEPLPEFTAVFSGLAAGDSPESLGKLVFQTTASPGCSCGTYSIAPEGLSSPNYQFEYINGKLEVLPAAVTIRADDKNMMYGAPLPELTASVSGLVNGDTIESLGCLKFKTGPGAVTGTGSYVIEPGELSAPDYEISYINGTLTVSPAVLTVKVDDLSIVYGQPLPELTATISELVDGDSIESLGKLIFKTDWDKTCAGNFSISAAGLSSPDYSFEYIPGKLIVLRAPLTVKADDKVMESGKWLPEFTATSKGLVNGETIEALGTVSFQTTAMPGSLPGKYEIIPSSGLTSSNYDIVYENGVLTVSPPAAVNNAPSTELNPDIEPDRRVKQEQKKPRLGEILIGDGKITSEDLDKALGRQQKIGDILVNEGKITQGDLVNALSKQLDLPALDINTFHISNDALKLVPASIACQYQVIPLIVQGDYLMVAMADPTNIMAIETLTAVTKMRIKPVIASTDDVKRALDRNYKNFGELEKQFSDDGKKTATAVKELDAAIAEAPAVRALDIIVEEAVKNRASDIHIEPQEDKVRIRYRIDGVMNEVSFLPIQAHGPLISRLKVLSDMNIADHRPQDGQFSFKTPDKDVDVRVATISTAYGEMGTLRILDKSFAVRTLKDVGFAPQNLELYRKMLKSPFGMILVSGPTGSGKTTTLYASINSLDTKQLKIITIEDPVEYHFDGINQIQVNPRAGLTFSDGLRSIMRHDPDVALVGEIRDRDTAATAVQAAMTGHLVLASVHANDTVGVLFRLIDLGIEPFLLASALIGVVAQRMVRRICPHCAEERAVSIENQMAYLEEIGEERDHFTFGKGCQICSNTGYFGRTAVMEMLTVSDEIRRLMLSGAGSTQLRTQAVKEGMISMRHDGMLKVKAGITTPNEIMRNVFSIQ